MDLSLCHGFAILCGSFTFRGGGGFTLSTLQINDDLRNTGFFILAMDSTGALSFPMRDRLRYPETHEVCQSSLP